MNGRKTPGENTKRKAGRPKKYSKNTVDKILQAVREGNTYELAAKLGGIAYSTLAEWRNVHPEFSEAIKTADEEAERVLIDRIKTAGQDPKFWQANAWILERRFPDRWGRKERVEHTGKDGGPVVLSHLSDDEVIRRAREIIRGS